MQIPFSRVHVDSEVHVLKAVVLQPPGRAHRNILPEHVESHLTLKDFVYRRLRINEGELESLRLIDPAGNVRLDLMTLEDLKLAYRTADGHEGTLSLSPTLESLFVDNPQYLLFDDIVDDARIRREYEVFERVVRTVAPYTFNFTNLTHDALHQLELDDAAQSEFFTRLEQLSPLEERENARRSRVYFNNYGPRRFLKLLISGRDHFGRYVFQPMPNLLFTRDLAATVGNALVLSSAAKPARARDSVLAWLVFTHHPIFRELAAGAGLTRVDMQGLRLAASDPNEVLLEGGDLVHLGNGVLMVGVGERTRPAGVMAMAGGLWSDGQPGSSGIERIVLTQIINKRSAMHLDTIFTLADQDGLEIDAMVFAPFLQKGGYGALKATVLEPSDFSGGKRPNWSELTYRSFSSLSELLRETAEIELRPYFCGGRRPKPTRLEASWQTEWENPNEVFFGKLPNEPDAKREQWTDGANLFALAPGVVITYARNRATLNELAANGFELVTPEQFCANAQFYIRHRGPNSTQPARLVIPIDGSELSRGRGGPRCMTLPLLREGVSR